MSGETLTILYDVFRWEERSLLQTAGRLGLGVEAVHVSTSRFPLRRGGEGGVALLRVTSQHRAVAAASIYGLYGYRVVNSPLSTRIMMDKLWTHTILLEHGIPMPETIVAFSQEEALEAAERLGYPVVVKPVQGSWGRLLALARDRDSLRSILEYAHYMGPQYRVYYIQEYVEKPGRDIRLFCLNGKPLTGIYRVSSDWITNTARGGRAEPLGEDALEGEPGRLAVGACEALGAFFAGVDIVEDPERGPLVLEVNAVPEYKNTVRVTGVDVSARLLEELAGLARGEAREGILSEAG